MSALRRLYLWVHLAASAAAGGHYPCPPYPRGGRVVFPCTCGREF